MSNIKKGFLFAILSPFFYSLRALTMKPTQELSPAFYALCVTAVSFIFLIPLFFKQRAVLKSKNFKQIFIQSLLMCSMFVCSIYGFQNLALSDAMLIENCLPLFILLIVLVFQKKRVGFGPSISVIIGFIGLSFILKPKLDLGHLAVFASLGSAILGAMNSVQLSKITKIDHPITVLFYSGIFSIFLYAVLSFFSQGVIHAEVWKYIFFASIFAAFFRYFVVRAYALLPPHIVGGFIYLSIFFSTLFDWIFWDQRLDLWQIVGGVIIVSSGLLILKENERLLKEEQTIQSAESES